MGMDGLCTAIGRAHTPLSNIFTTFILSLRNFYVLRCCVGIISSLLILFLSFGLVFCNIWTRHTNAKILSVYYNYRYIYDEK